MNKKPLYKNKLFWLAAVFISYSAIGFFAVPKIIESQLQQASENQLNSSVDFEKIRFNPFRFNTNVYKLQFTDKDQQTWFKADQVSANLELFASLFGDWKISDFELHKPYFHLELEPNKQGSDLKYPKITPSESESQTESQTEFHIEVQNIALHNGGLFFKDSSSDKGTHLEMKEIQFKNAGFTTRDRFSDFELYLKTENNDEINLNGSANLPKKQTQGSWSIQNFSTKTLFYMLSESEEQIFGLQNQSGSIDANGEYSFSINDQVNPKIELTQLTLKNFETVETLDSAPQIKLPELVIENAVLNPVANSLDIDSIRLQAPQVTSKFTANAQPVWTALETLNSSENKDGSNDENGLKLNIQQISIADFGIKTIKPRLQDNFEQLWQVPDLQVKNYNNQNQETNLQLKIKPESSGDILAQSSIQWQPLVINSDISATKVDLKKLQAWVPEDVRLSIDAGLLNFNHKLNLKEDSYLITGETKINQLNLLDQNQNSFFQADGLNILQSTINSKQQSIVLNKIQLDQAKGQLIYGSDGQLNINSIIQDPEDKEKIKGKIKDTKTDWKIKIDEVEMIDLNSKFIDKSIQPNYQTELSKVNGAIKGLSSLNTSKAKVDINGRIDSYGKFDIVGDINPLSDDAYTDLKVNIENINLQNFDSYAKKFIGFPITKGKADLKLDYKLNEKLLKGINDLKFKQLELGSKIQNDTAVDLPLKLALSLLTDGDGNMPIYLPVKGRIDDPEFSYGGLVFKAVFKLITGIVASPFKLLGKLVPGGADLDMSGIYFTPGTSILQADEEQKLQALKDIMQKRPALILEISPLINSTEDAKALKQKALLESLSWSEVPDFTQSDDIAVLKNKFSESGKSAQWEQLQTNNTQEKSLNSQQLGLDAWAALLENSAEPEALTLETLAKDRGLSIQKHLIETLELPESRVFLKSKITSDSLPPQVQFGINH